MNTLSLILRPHSHNHYYACFSVCQVVNDVEIHVAYAVIRRNDLFISYGASLFSYDLDFNSFSFNPVTDNLFAKYSLSCDVNCTFSAVYFNRSRVSHASAIYMGWNILYNPLRLDFNDKYYEWYSHEVIGRNISIQFRF